MTDESRVIFVAKGVGAFFGFLLLFFGVSAYLGGGITGIGVSIVLAIAVALILVILGPRIREQKRTVDSKVPAPAPVAGSTEVCPPGPHDVVAGEPTKLELNVKRGDRVSGFVREINGDFFDWYIVDENNLIRFFDERRFDYIDGDENTVVSKVQCRIPRAGPWYLLLDIGSRVNDREVEVSLRVVPN